MGSLSGRGAEVSGELRKMMIDVCVLQKVRWRGQGARMLEMKGRRYMLWWSVKGDGVGGVIARHPILHRTRIHGERNV